MPELAAAYPALVRLKFPLRWAAALTLAVSRGAGVVAQVCVQIAVGALGGPGALGLLQLLTSWTALLGEVLSIGYPTRAMRDAAVLSASGKPRAVRKTLRRAASRVALAGVGLAVLLCIAVAVSGSSAPDIDRSLIVALAMAAPLFALSRVWSEALKGLQRPLIAVTLENLTTPTALLALCGALALAQRALSRELLLLGVVVGIAATAALSLMALHRRLVRLHEDSAPSPANGAAAQTTITEIAPHLTTDRREQLHFWCNGLLNIAFLQLPFLMLPLFASAEEIGRYAVAHKLLNIITTLLILQAAVYGPRFARAAAQQNAGELAALLWRTQLVSAAIFLPSAAVLLGASAPLAGVFSLPGGSLLPLLLVLCGGQVVNALTGLSGVLLTMSGNAASETRLQLAAIIATASAAFLIAPSHGIYGVAAAASAGIAGKNLASWLLARKRIHALGRPSA